MQFRKLQMLLAACTTAVLLAACGGGGDAAGPKAPITRVFVAGDSLADAGTFGFKFTVQKAAAPAEGYPNFTQLVAQDYGINGQCNFYAFNGTTFVPNATAGCTNFAIGNGRIQNTTAQGGAAGPQSVPLQLATMAQVYGPFTSTDLVIVDGGGNDFDDLMNAYAGGAGTLVPFLSTLVGNATVTAVLGGPNGSVSAGVLYMQKLADQYYGAVNTSLLANGATHVALLNMPDVTVTPLFAAAMANASAGAGGGAAGATAAAQLQGLGRALITAFNAQLTARVGGDSRIGLVDAYSDIQDQAANPAAYGLTNVTQKACGAVAIQACADAALNAAPPAGLAANWWTTYAFADGLHPTPYGYQLLAASVSRALARAGWL
jgi:phospholipase/lecithinase/hemolysin